MEQAPVKIGEIEIYQENNTLMCSSFQVAEHFGRAHKTILESIRTLKKQMPEEWVRQNFLPMLKSLDKPGFDVKTKTKSPYYLISLEGFLLLVGGFTGEKAFEMRKKFVLSFSEMVTQVQGLEERDNSPKCNIGKITFYIFYVLHNCQFTSIRETIYCFSSYNNHAHSAAT